MRNAGYESVRWTPSTVEGRWCGFGPYYAMFPVEFARNVVDQFCPKGGSVLDPFCGRGTAPFVASVTGRRALGTDVNPVAWLFSAVKLNPCPTAEPITERVFDVLAAVRAHDRIASSEFQEWAWHREVLGFLKAARRELNWRGNRVDRTLMATILVHLHAKRGEGLSNQLRQSKSMSPAYAVQWWKKRHMRPPEIDIVEFFDDKLSWRYAKGVPTYSGAAEVRLGDARRVLAQMDSVHADLIVTSPPYFGLTNYRYDNWMRLWMLGGPHLPVHKTAERYAHGQRYRGLLDSAFAQGKRHCKPGATIYVRADAREFSRNATEQALRKVWPDHTLFHRFDKPNKDTQTALFQNDSSDAGEVDFLLTGSKKVGVPDGFVG